MVLPKPKKARSKAQLAAFEKIVGRITNQKEFKSLQEEVLHADCDTMSGIMEYVFRTKHDNMIVDLETNKLYRNFNRLVIEGVGDSI